MRISSWGPRPAASVAERRAHRYLARGLPPGVAGRRRAAFLGAGPGALAQRDRHLRRPALVPARRDGAHRHAPRSAGRERQRVRPRRARRARGQAAELSQALRRLARGDRRRGAHLHRLARPPRSARARAPGAVAARTRAASAGRCRSTRSAATGRSGCALPSPAQARRGGRPAARRPAAPACRSPGSATRPPATPTTASSSCSACRRAKLGVGAGGEPCRHSPCDTARPPRPGLATPRPPAGRVGPARPV